jgi:broad specificity phosphatase PhoE
MLIPVIRLGQFRRTETDLPPYEYFISSLGETSREYPLTELGREQIRESAKSLKPYLGQTLLVLCSNFFRTQQSAKVLAEALYPSKAKIVATPLLNTIYMPPGTLSEEEFYKLSNDSNPYAVPDKMFDLWAQGGTGESPDMVKERIGTLLNLVGMAMSETPPQQPVMVTHSSLASALFRHANGLPLTLPRTFDHILNPAGYFTIEMNNKGLTAAWDQKHFMGYNMAYSEV